MTKIVLFSLLSFFVSPLFAQVELVLRVDMSNEIISPEGLYVTGSFLDWSLENAVEMIEEGDDIYSATLEMEPGSYEYAFLNGQSDAIRECDDAENCEEDCFVESSDGQRVRAVLVEENAVRQTLAAYIFNSCEETLPASIEALKNSRNLSISPNPFSAETTLAFANPKNQSFAVLLYDLNGKLIRNYPGLRGDSFEIDRIDLSTGIYVLALRTDKGEVANRKLVVH